MGMGVERGRRFFSVGRTVRLVRACLVEQVNPASFYLPLAADSVSLVERFGGVEGRLVLDVGAGPGYFAQAFGAAGARYVSVDARPVGMVCGDGLALPVRSGVVDVCFSSNVLEHVSDPRRMFEEMLRVTRPGGLVFLCYTNWLGPLGGHETAPWHYLGGKRAARIYERRYGAAGESVWDVVVRVVGDPGAGVGSGG
ncbi:class I SAM-dependent methyltransferase [Catenulispora yoronensis]